MSNYTILIVDYEPRSVEWAKRILEGADFKVEVAHDGVSGLEAFEKLRPDLVLIEAMLPKKHGFEVCQEIKKTNHGKRTPVLITTAVYRGRKYRTQAVHIYGCDEYVEKPISEEDFLETCKRCLSAESVGAPSEQEEVKGEPEPEARSDAPAQPASADASLSPIVGDLTEEDINARLDAILPSDPIDDAVPAMGETVTGSRQAVAVATAACPEPVVEAPAPEPVDERGPGLHESAKSPGGGIVDDVPVDGSLTQDADEDTDGVETDQTSAVEGSEDPAEVGVPSQRDETLGQGARVVPFDPARARKQPAPDQAEPESSEESLDEATTEQIEQAIDAAFSLDAPEVAADDESASGEAEEPSADAACPEPVEGPVSEFVEDLVAGQEAEPAESETRFAAEAASCPEPAEDATPETVEEPSDEPVPAPAADYEGLDEEAVAPEAEQEAASHVPMGDGYAKGDYEEATAEGAPAESDLESVQAPRAGHHAKRWVLAAAAIIVLGLIVGYVLFFGGRDSDTGAAGSREDSPSSGALTPAPALPEPVEEIAPEPTTDPAEDSATAPEAGVIDPELQAPIRETPPAARDQTPPARKPSVSTPAPAATGNAREPEGAPPATVETAEPESPVEAAPPPETAPVPVAAATEPPTLMSEEPAREDAVVETDSTATSSTTEPAEPINAAPVDDEPGETPAAPEPEESVSEVETQPESTPAAMGATSPSILAEKPVEVAAQPEPAPPPAQPKPSVRTGDLIGLSDADSVPVSLERALPAYPAIARRLRREGTALLNLLIDHEGKVEQVRIVRSAGHSSLDAAAQEAAMGWTYKPAMKDGVAVKVWKLERISFKL